MDPEAQSVESNSLSLSPSEAAVERVIIKVFRHHHCDVVITDRLRSLFTLKLWRMGKAIQGLGGTARKKKYDQWRASTWVVELKGEEIILPPNCKIKQNNAVLQAKRMNLEEELAAANKKIEDLSDRYATLEQSCNDLSKSIAVEEGASATPGTRKRKSWAEYTPQYRKKRIQQVANKVQAAVSFAKDEHFKATKVELTNQQTGDIVAIDASGKTVTVKQATSEGSQSSSSNVVDQTLYVKERFNVSHEAYHEMARVIPEMPRLSKLLKKAATLNTKATIKPVPGTLQGVQQSLRNCLEKKLGNLQRVNPSFCSNREVWVKLSGDGTTVSRSVHLVVIAFIIIHNEIIANSPNDHCTIALVNCKESYECIAECVTDILTEIESLNSLQVGEYTYNFTYFLGADMKFLAMALGIEAANSTYSCVWCKCPARDRHDITKEWSVTDGTNGGARTIAEIQECARIRKKKGTEDLKCGCINRPIFPCIPITRVIPDILHLFLRISDVLTNLLISELRRMDGIDKVNSKANNTTRISQYEKFLNEECKINFHFYTDKNSKEVKWRDLVGPEKLKLFSKLNLPQMYPDLPNAQKIQKIWKDFLSIYNLLRSVNTGSQEIKQEAKEWITLFLEVYQTKHVTPYMHTLIYHIPEFISLHGSLAPFSQQGLERLNDTITKDYFRSTNHRDDALQSLLKKLNRLEELRDTEEQTHHQIHCCKLCKQPGHNSRTCYLNSK